MFLKFQKPNGTIMEVPLTQQPLTIGRSPKADIIIDDEKASRMHCGIRWVDDAYVAKDLGSKNGTFLNDERIEAETLQAGDKIRVGGTVFTLEKQSTKGATTAFHEMEQELSQGKGYDTILKEIVGSSKPKRS